MSGSSTTPTASADLRTERRGIFTERGIVLLIALLGALLRLWYLLDYSGSPLFDLPLGADVQEYWARANGILAGRFFPDTPDIHAPLYPWVLAFMLKLCRGSIPAVRAVQAMLNFGAWFAVYLLLRRQRIPEKLRLVFLAVAVLMPVPVFYHSELVSESLLLPLAAGFLWLIDAARSARTGSRRTAAAFGAGAALALMNLAHPLTLFFSAAEIARSFLRRRCREGVPMLAAVLTLVGGFCAARSVNYGRLCGIQSNAGFNIFLGNNPDAKGGCYLRPGAAWRRIHLQAAREAERKGISADRLFLRRAGAFWLERPFRALALWGRKALMVCHPGELPSGADVAPLLCATTAVFWGRLLTPALTVLAAFGLWRIFRRRERRCFGHYLVLFLSLYAAQIVTVTSGRYRLLMFLPAALFAALGICEFNWRRRWWLLPAAVVGCGAITITAYGSGRPEAAALYAEAALRRGDFHLADELGTYIERDPYRFDPAQGAVLRGAAAEKTALEALDECRRAAAERRPEAAAAYEIAARRKFDLADKHYARAAKHDPNFYRAWMNRANLAVMRGDIGRAEEWYRTALKLAPRAPELCYNYARFRIVSGAPAAEAVAAALAAAPRDAKVWNLAGLSAMRDGDFRRAGDCFDRAAGFATDDAQRERYLNNRRLADERLREDRK